MQRPMPVPLPRPWLRELPRHQQPAWITVHGQSVCSTCAQRPVCCTKRPVFCTNAPSAAPVRDNTNGMAYRLPRPSLPSFKAPKVAPFNSPTPHHPLKAPVASPGWYSA